MFSGNSAGAYGGGMYNLMSSPWVSDSVFIGNNATYIGGGMGNQYGYGDDGSVVGSDPWVANSLFIGNVVGFHGGGMFSQNSSLVVTNCTFSGNSACDPDSNGGGMFFDCDIQPCGYSIVHNCVLWGDSPNELVGSTSTLDASYSNVQGGRPGPGNIDADPMFVDLDNGDYRLSPGSPCIDAGDNTAVPDGIDTDLDGNPRFVDDPDTTDTGYGDPPIVDMGAYEYQGPPCPWDLNGDGNVFVTDLLMLLASWGPCPGCPADFN